MKSKKRTSIIGLWILLAIAILYFGLSYLKGLPFFRNSNIYYVRFPNVSSVAVASPVKINGFKVGSVRKLYFDIDKKGSTIVALSVDKDYPLPQDTQASVKKGFLGGSEIDLSLGNSSIQLADKDTIMAQKEGPDYMAMLNNQVIPQVMAILPKADSILSAINALANDPALPKAIDELHETISAAHKAMHHIAGASQNIESFSNKQLPKITKKIQLFTNQLTSLSQAVDSTELATAIQNISATSSSLKEISKKIEKTLEENNSSIGALVNERDLYNRIDSLVQSADSLVKDIKAHPKKYLKISVF